MVSQRPHQGNGLIALTKRNNRVLIGGIFAKRGDEPLVAHPLLNIYVIVCSILS